MRPLDRAEMASELGVEATAFDSSQSSGNADTRHNTQNKTRHEGERDALPAPILSQGF